MPTSVYRAPESSPLQFLHGAAFIFAVILVASLFGILTRPMGFLAAVWPANAILMALMVRNPALSRPECWTAAFLAYVAADLITGSELLVTLWLTVANLVGAAVGYQLYARLDEDDRRLRTPMSIVSMFCICAIAAAAIGIVGSGVGTMLFSRDLLTGFAFWFTTALVNSIIVLPVILAAPPGRTLWNGLRHFEFRKHDWRPIATLAFTTAGGILVGGPGAFAYPMPALIWCALTYNLFTTSLVTLCFCLVGLISTAIGIIPSFPGNDNLLVTVSVRLAMALLALAPLAVAIVNGARNDLLNRLQYIANHDALTGTLSRRAFLEMSEKKLRSGQISRSPFLAVMVDLDHFKTINDRYGHATGDMVLAESTIAMSKSLRKGDLFGRLGGEEFAVICSVQSEDDITSIPERLRAAVEALKFATPDGAMVGVTVSVGTAALVAEPGDTGALDRLLAAADEALYRAKAQGRNMVAIGKVAAARHETPPALSFAIAKA